METFTEQILDHLETGSPLSAEQHSAIDFARVTRVLLRDGTWHSVYRIDVEKERAALAETLAHVRRKFDALCRNKTDAEVIAAFPAYVPYRQHPALRPAPLEAITIGGQRWVRWNESREKESGALILSEVLAPMSEVAALDLEKGV
jgi:hypothetical protein